MTDCTPKSIPCDTNIQFTNLGDESNFLEDPRIYREMVGSLIYLTSCTRPDLCFIVSTLSQYLSKPTYAHLNLCKNVLRYLKGHWTMV